MHKFPHYGAIRVLGECFVVGRKRGCNPERWVPGACEQYDSSVLLLCAQLIPPFFNRRFVGTEE